MAGLELRCDQAKIPPAAPNSNMSQRNAVIGAQNVFVRKRCARQNRTSRNNCSGLADKRSTVHGLRGIAHRGLQFWFRLWGTLPPLFASDPRTTPSVTSISVKD